MINETYKGYQLLISQSTDMWGYYQYSVVKNNGEYLLKGSSQIHGTDHWMLRDRLVDAVKSDIRSDCSVTNNQPNTKES